MRRSASGAAAKLYCRWATIYIHLEGRGTFSSALSSEARGDADAAVDNQIAATSYLESAECGHSKNTKMNGRAHQLESRGDADAAVDNPRLWLTGYSENGNLLT